MTPRKRFVATAVVLLAAVLVPRNASAAVPTYTLYGRGWGHGIGMSQWGAKGLADKGWTTSQITTHFYKGTAIATQAIPGTIRVGLIQNQGVIEIVGNGPFDLYDNKGTKRATGAASQTWRLQKGTGTNIDVLDPSGKLAFSSGSPIDTRFETQGTQLKIIDTGYTYKHGHIGFELNSQSALLQAVLVVPFEQYLYGLGEMPSSWASEALKVQALAGRSYAAEKISRLGQKRAACDCAVYASTLDQAYVGIAQEVSRWVAAVDATKSQLITSGGKPIQALYSASDGGFTENNENVWGGTAFSYLRGACDPGDYAAGANPRANWHVTFDGNEIASALASGGYSVGTVTKLEVLDPRGVSGRVRSVIDSTHGGWRVTGAKSTARISAGTFQSLLGLQSTLILHNITGSIRLKYDSMNCTPGWPRGEASTWKNLDGTTRGLAQDFNTGGRMFYNSATGKVFWIYGAIITRYNDLRKQGIDLGMPLKDEYKISGGARADFEHGYITWNASKNTTHLVRT